MKILDRYVLTSFLKNYVLSFMILVGLYVILDMLFNFDELMAVSAKDAAGTGASILSLVQTIGDYYFYQMFLIFVQLSGIIPVVAAAFTLMRMSRFNELSAMLSAGVPLLKVTRPIIFATIILNVFVYADQELLIPHMIPKLTRKHNEAKQESGNRFTINSMQDDSNRILVAGWYYPGAEKPWMQKVAIIERDAEFRRTRQIIAEKAEWDPRGSQWKLTDAKVTTGLLPGETAVVDDYHDAYKSSITPEEIGLYRSANFVNLLSTDKINKLLDRKLSYGANALLRVKHSRFTQLLLNIVLLLLAIPCVLTREPGKLKRSAMKCLILIGICMGSVFVTQMLAGQPPNARWEDQWPALMAWVPIFIFCPLAVWLLDHVET